MDAWIGIVCCVFLVVVLVFVGAYIRNQATILTWCEAGGHSDHIRYEERTLCIGIDQEGQPTAEWLDDVKARLEIAY